MVIDIISKVFRNKVLIYIFSRYFSYFIQFLNSVIIAYKLDPFYLGIWGFVTLIIQYLSFGNFGIDYALNVKLSTTDSNIPDEQSRTVSNALYATSFTCLVFLLIGLTLKILDIDVFEKYSFSTYVLIVVAIGCINFFNSLFVNLFRSYSIYGPISFFQFIIQLLQLLVVFVLNGRQLIYGALCAIFFGHIISCAMFLRRFPVKISFGINFTIIRSLFARGIMLLFYNISFYLLLLSTRTLVSAFYSVQNMGQFTFASNIASAIILGLGSLEFLVFPKMINRLRENVSNEMAYKNIKELRKVYLTSAYLIVILGLLVYPIILFFFSNYVGTTRLFALLIICQVIISSGFGYSALLISRGQELYLAIHGLIAIGINLGLSFLGYRFFNIDYSLMATFLVISFFYYEIQVISKGRKLLGLGNSIKDILNDILPVKYLIPFILIITGIFTGRFQMFFLLGFLTFLMLNIKDFSTIINYVKTLIKQPDIISIN